MTSTTMKRSIDATDDVDNRVIVHKTRVVFKVMNFAKRLDANWTEVKYINSDKFSIGSDEWYCSIKLDGEKFGLYLHLSASSDLPVETQYELYIIEYNNQLYEYKDTNYVFEKINGYGWPTFTTKQQLIDNKVSLLDNNTLTICIDLTVHKKNNNHQNCVSKRRFAQLFGVKELTDCRLIVDKDKKEFFVSKFVLSLKSVVFEKMFTNDCKEKSDNEVIIDDVDSDVFEQFLKYLYTNTCDKLVDMCKDLLYVSDKYMIEPLKTICLNLLYLRINCNNALEIRKTLKDFGADEELMKKVNQYIGENITSVISKEFIDMYGIDPEEVPQIVCHFDKHLPKVNTKLMFYTYEYIN
ncbi:speckle-type POZ protein B-like [Oppia nitens]|uniref:speckle-type POZ protein B-like n=1 Tax=Oppia nitens TaxID=1686743 RepID=UPI0023DCAE4D|nr:speckle-type POZ protein B-like [Oppia nitens]